MDTSHLMWKLGESREIFRTRLFAIREIEGISPEGEKKIFTIEDPPDWVIVIPVIEREGRKHFVMVRQWRHGSQCLSLEFPGGLVEDGESAEAGAIRELGEETAFSAKKLRRLAAMSPNPAVMSNLVHYYYAEDLVPLKGQNLDDDEFVDVELIPVDEVKANMGEPPYIHSLTAAALAMYLTKVSCCS